MQYAHYVPSNSPKFTKTFSIGMFKHVRCINYDLFFKTVYDVLDEKGRFVLHTITTSRNDTLCRKGSTKNFLTEYIFPGGQIPKMNGFWIVPNGVD